LNIEKNKRFINTLSFKLIAICLVILVAFTVGVISSTIISYSNYVNENALNQNTILSEQVLFNYETYFKNISNVSYLIQDEIYNEKDIYSSKDTFTAYFDNVISIKTEISNISVYDLDGTYIVGDSKNSKENVKIDEEWFKSAKNNQLIDNFSPVTYSGDTYNIILSRYGESNKGERKCIMRMDLDFTSIVNSIYKVDLGTNGHIVIYDKNYNLVYTSSSEYSNDEITLLENNVLGTHRATIDSSEFVITQYTISNTTWRVAVFSNVDSVRSLINKFIFTAIILAVIVFIAVSILLIFTVRSTTQPLRKLQSAMNKVRNSDYLNYVPVKIKGSTEVQDLNESYNAMMEQIKKLMSNVVEEQTNQRKSEFKALTNQINPHFLYNTLDSIIYLIDEGKNDDAQTIVLALSKFFRISISKGRTIIPLESEIEHIKNYLIIQKMRYKDAFKYEIKADKNCLQYAVIKLILQPIVENAIYHGIKDKENGLIEVNCYEENGFLKLSVKDNGYGITESKINEIKKSFDDPEVYNGVGLKNVYQRLKIYYGNRADLEIHSDLDVGTTIILLIPIEGVSNKEVI